jgi:ABC-type spermidine/putrescine transport system permease subunit II
MIVPNFVVALALYFIFIKLGLIGSYITYVLAYGVFAFPVVFLVMYAAFQRFDFSLIQAGANLGAAPLSIWRRIVVPILLPSFLSAAVFAFLTAFDDLIVALFFSTAGKYTLPMRMWADIRNEISPQIAAVAVIFFALALAASAVFALGRFLRRRRSNHPLPAAVQSPS